MSVRVRFAPSPTGHVHIGNIRAAILNWLFARHEGGQFLLRVEDTDRERSTPEAVQTLLAAMQWLELEPDEEPVYQSTRRPRHDAAVAAMIERGLASRITPDGPAVLHMTSALFDPSFVTESRDPVEIDVSQAETAISAPGVAVTTRGAGREAVTERLNWDALTDLEIATADAATHSGAALRVRAGESREPVALESLLGSRPVSLRFRRRFVHYDDLVLGRLEKPLDSIRDLVIARADGSPVFHLANCVDDHEMGVTHVLRGNDHVENTYRHLFIYRAMGVTPPQFGHFPMILNDRGRPYSKRDGDAYVGDFQARGILPDCLFNFLALCGWSPGDDREVMSKAEMIEAFTLDRVVKSGAQLNMKKLLWMNQRYIAAMPPEKLQAALRGELRRAGRDPDAVDPAWFAFLAEQMRPRLRTLAEFPAETACFFDEDVTIDDKARGKVLLANGGAGLDVLRRVREPLAAAGDWTVASLETAVTAFLEASGLEIGQVAQPLRVAVTGRTASPGIHETLFLVGRERTLRRIEEALRSE